MVTSVVKHKPLRRTFGVLSDEGLFMYNRPKTGRCGPQGVGMNTATLNTIQLAMTVLNGYVVSRLLIKCGIAERMVQLFLAKSAGKVSWVLVFVLCTSAGLSLFMPNMVAVLAVIPILEVLRKACSDLDAGGERSATTALAMANLYGANIGGTGSVTGTPANLLVIQFMAMNHVPGFEKLNFLSWLGWGIPLAAILVCVGSFIIIKFIVPEPAMRHCIDFAPYRTRHEYRAHQKLGFILSGSSFLFWTFISLLNILGGDAIMVASTALGLVFMLLFLALVYLFPITDRKLGAASRMLTIQDTVARFPLKPALILFGIIAIFAAAAYAFDLKNALGTFFRFRIDPDGNHFPLIFLFALCTIFVSEFVSNTLAALGFFAAALVVFGSLPSHLMPVLLAISLASNLPCMTPIASPVNAFAYAGVKGVSLARMMRAGLVMDVISAALVAVWAEFVIPWFYSI
jgi:solute carrier family 13 (sodium-dependent dicarboxylate transporter), member 2/3/5